MLGLREADADTGVQGNERSGEPDGGLVARGALWASRRRQPFQIGFFHSAVCIQSPPCLFVALQLSSFSF